VARGTIESFEEYKKVNVKESNRMLENERVEKNRWKAPPADM
jgi:hypothetical protein